MTFRAGAGLSTNTNNGGDGGGVNIFGGEARGRSEKKDIGGPVHIEGKVEIFSGTGTSTCSGDMDIQTANSGLKGSSGTINLRSGNATLGASGCLNISTGNSRPAAAGSILVSVGTGQAGDGGDVTVTAGEMTALRSTGGRVNIAGGLGSSRSAGGGGKGGPVTVSGGEAGGRSTSDQGSLLLLGAFY